jgi:hypothetical protein
MNIANNYIYTGKPIDIPHVESFNGKFRDACLNVIGGGTRLRQLKIIDGITTFSIHPTKSLI